MNTERLDMLMRDQKLTDDTKAPIQSVGMHRRTSSGMLTAQLPIPEISHLLSTPKLFRRTAEEINVATF